MRLGCHTERRSDLDACKADCMVHRLAEWGVDPAAIDTRMGEQGCRKLEISDRSFACLLDRLGHGRVTSDGAAACMRRRLSEEQPSGANRVTVTADGRRIALAGCLWKGNKAGSDGTRSERASKVGEERRGWEAKRTRQTRWGKGHIGRQGGMRREVREGRQGEEGDGGRRRGEQSFQKTQARGTVGESGKRTTRRRGVGAVVYAAVAAAGSAACLRADSCFCW